VTNASFASCGTRHQLREELEQQSELDSELEQFTSAQELLGITQTLEEETTVVSHIMEASVVIKLRRSRRDVRLRHVSVWLVVVVCFVWCPPSNWRRMAAQATLSRPQLTPDGRPLHAYASLLPRDSQSCSYFREQIQSAIPEWCTRD
jgi:hypothetical protein